MPDEYLGSILKLCQDRRGIQKNLTYVGGRAQATYELPLNEVVFDFYDRLKSISRGYASFDYHQIGYREGDLVKMSILVNNEPVDALSMIVHRGTAEARGRGMCERLKDLIPRHLFKIPIQAAIGGKVIAPRDDRGAAQGRDGEVLRRRRQPQAQAARQAERGQEADAGIWLGEHSAGGVYCGAAGWATTRDAQRLRPGRGLREQSPSWTKISASAAGDRSSLSSTGSSDDAALPRRHSPSGRFFDFFFFFRC